MRLSVCLYTVIVSYPQHFLWDILDTIYFVGLVKSKIDLPPVKMRYRIDFHSDLDLKKELSSILY